MVWRFFLKNMSRRVLFGLSMVVLTVLVVACGSSSTTTSTTKTQPVKQVLTATPTAATLKEYKGSDFTISYPQNWKVATSSNEVAFTDPTGNYNLTIGSTSNPDEKITADQLANGGASGAKTNLKNAQDITVPKTTTIGGVEWSQRALSGTSTYNGQNSDVEAGVVATNHPTKSAKTKGYVIAYVSLKQQFAAASDAYFMPMLQSFKFNS